MEQSTSKELKYYSNPRNIILLQEDEYKGFEEKQIKNKKRYKCKLINKKEYCPEWILMNK